MLVKNLRIIWKQIIKTNCLIYLEVMIGHVVALKEMILGEDEVETGVIEDGEVGYLEVEEGEDLEVEEEAEVLGGFLLQGMSVDLVLQGIE